MNIEKLRIKIRKYKPFLLAFVAVAAVLIYALLALGCYYAFEDRILTMSSVFFTASVFLFASYGLGFGAACLMGAATFLMILVDRHLGVHYNYLFATLGKQLILVLRSTNEVEVLGYLSMFSVSEYCFFLLIFIFWGTFYWFFRKEIQKASFCKYKRLIALGLAIGILGSSYYGRTAQPFGDYISELRKNGDVLKQHSAFQFYAEDMDKSNTERTYILLIGETHRFDHFHAFGYSRETSPNLDKAKELPGFYYFEDMISGYTLTQHSLPVIMTRKPISYNNNLFYEKSLLSAFKEAGYKTYFITYLNANHPFEDGVALISGEANIFVNHRAISKTTEDDGILKALDKVYKDEEKKKFIVIKMIGVHFEFEKRYPAAFDRFLPSYKSTKAERSLNNRSILINTYDNAMLYSDKIIGEILERVKLAEHPEMLMFISDHGTTLYDDGKTEDRGLSRGNYHVPFFLYGNKAYWRTSSAGISENLYCNKKSPLTHEFIFDTFLRLSKIGYPGYRVDMDLSSYCVNGADERKVWTFDGRNILYRDIEK